MADDCLCTHLVCRECKRDVTLDHEGTRLFALKKENSDLKARLRAFELFVESTNALVDENGTLYDEAFDDLVSNLSVTDHPYIGRRRKTYRFEKPAEDEDNGLG